MQPTWRACIEYFKHQFDMREVEMFSVMNKWFELGVTEIFNDLDVFDAVKSPLHFFAIDSAYSVLSVNYLISSYLIRRSMIIAC